MERWSKILFWVQAEPVPYNWVKADDKGKYCRNGFFVRLRNE